MRLSYQISKFISINEFSIHTHQPRVIYLDIISENSETEQIVLLINMLRLYPAET